MTSCGSSESSGMETVVSQVVFNRGPWELKKKHHYTYIKHKWLTNGLRVSGSFKKRRKRLKRMGEGEGGGEGGEN